MKLKIAAALLCLLIGVAGAAVVKYWPWFSAPPAPADVIEAQWETVVRLAEPPEVCDGDLSDWDALGDALDELSDESEELIQDRYMDELPLPMEALPPDVQAVLNGALHWAEGERGYSIAPAHRVSPLALHRVGQIIGLLENPLPEHDRLLVELGSRAFRCGDAVDFAVGVQFGEAVVTRAEESGAHASFELLVLTPDELAPLTARDAVQLFQHVEDIGASASDIRGPYGSGVPFVYPSREIEMYRWFHGERVARSLGAATVGEAAERLRWHYEDEGVKSVLLDTSTVSFESVFEDYLALHARIEAL